MQFLYRINRNQEMIFPLRAGVRPGERDRRKVMEEQTNGIFQNFVFFPGPVQKDVL